MTRRSNSTSCAMRRWNANGHNRNSERDAKRRDGDISNYRIHYDKSTVASILKTWRNTLGLTQLQAYSRVFGIPEEGKHDLAKHMWRYWENGKWTPSPENMHKLQLAGIFKLSPLEKYTAGLNKHNVAKALDEIGKEERKRNG